MADKNQDWKMGEYRGMVEREAVEYGGAVSAGDFLKITGINADGQPIVQKQTAATTAIYVAHYNQMVLLVMSKKLYVAQKVSR